MNLLKPSRDGDHEKLISNGERFLLPFLPYAPHTVTKHTILHGFATTCAVYAATVSAVYASNLLPHAPHTLANCYRTRCLR
jgi:hypothetical protein